MRASTAGVGAVHCLADDSMNYHYMLNEHSPTRSLDFLVKTYTDLGTYKSEVDRTNLVNEELRAVAKYNGIDAYAPIAVIESLKGSLKAEGVYSEQAIELFRRLTPYIACIEACGFKIDRERILHVEADLVLNNHQIQQELSAIAPGVNLNSPSQLSDFLFSSSGLNLPVPDMKDILNEDGRPSTRKQVLEKVDHPITELLRSFKQNQKVLGYIRSTKGKSILENLEDDGFVYPEYYLVKRESRGESSGSVSRIAVKYPPLQNIPRDSEVRSVGVSRYGDEGVLVELDGSQMELRWGAVVSEDPVLMSVFKNREDIHATTASFCGVSRDAPGGINGKNINFGLLFGISIHGLVDRFNLSKHKAQQIDSVLKEKYAGVFEYLKQVKATATQEGRVRTEYGMWRRVPGANPIDPKGRALLREAANYVIQRPASDMVQLLGWWLMLELDGIALPVMTSHDGLLWDLPRDNLEKTLDIMREGVAHFPTLVKEVLDVDLKGVPFEFDFQVGSNWKNKKKLEVT